MGTSWRVRLAHGPGVDLEALHRACQARLDGLVAQLSHWEPTSTLWRYNRAPPGSWTRLLPDFAAVLAAALEIAKRSDGAFDPAIGQLVNHWGFGPELGPGTLAAARAASGFAKLVLANGHLLQPGGLHLDLSGIAKGYAADALADLIGGHALVEVGGEHAGRGLRPDGDPWWVELESPADVEPLRVGLHQLGVATSGDYLRGRHTIDPATGHPVAHALSVSVVHLSAMRADAWATALSVLPRGAMTALAEREELAVRALLRENGGIVEWISPALAAMLDD